MLGLGFQPGRLQSSDFTTTTSVGTLPAVALE